MVFGFVNKISGLENCIRSRETTVKNKIADLIGDHSNWSVLAHLIALLLELRR